MSRHAAVTENFVKDLRYAWRGIGRRPVFSLTAVVTLAIGIGANTAIFTLLYSLLLRPLPVADPGRLARIHMAGPGRAAAHQP